MGERPSIDQVVERVSLWRGKDPPVSELSGGLTNRNYLVEADGTRYVVRIPGAATELLAVDRENERRNAEAAATTGVEPAHPGVPAGRVGDGARVHRRADDVGGGPARRRDGARASPSRCGGCTPGRGSTHDFDMFRLVEYYLGIVEQQGVRIPDGFRDRMPTVAEVERAVGVNALPWVPCHNDLLAENYIDDGRQLWIIDFEYSGNNDPCFELGDTAQECEFDEELRAALCAAYFGREDPVQLARMELFAYMADMGWTLWAAIQAKISEIDYDFWGWAEERWGRAVALMDSRGVPGRCSSQAAAQ